MTRPKALFFAAPVPYDVATELQERLVDARIEGRIPDVVLFLQHEPVVTLGARGSQAFLRQSPEALQAKGVHLAHASRGGDVTYHAPGQEIVYPILRLGGAEADTHRHLANLEGVAMRAAADFGVEARRREGMTGAWTDAGKIAAIGVRFRRWVSYHGMSFNVDIALSGFDVIVPCGLLGQPVASLRSILGADCPDSTTVRESLLTHCRSALGRDFERLSGKPCDLPRPWPELLGDAAALCAAPS